MCGFTSLTKANITTNQQRNPSADLYQNVCTSLVPIKNIVAQRGEPTPIQIRLKCTQNCPVKAFVGELSHPPNPPIQQRRCLVDGYCRHLFTTFWSHYCSPPAQSGQWTCCPNDIIMVRPIYLSSTSTLFTYWSSSICNSGVVMLVKRAHQLPDHHHNHTLTDYLVWLRWLSAQRLINKVKEVKTMLCNF